MSSHNNFHNAYFPQQQQTNYLSADNPKPTLNLLINKKSTLQKMNQQITFRTSDIKQHHKVSQLKLKNHYTNNDNHWPNNYYSHNNNTEKYSVRFQSPKSQLYKFNYGPMSTYFNQKRTTPLQTASQIKPRPSSSKVSFFYDNPYPISNSNNIIKDPQTPDSKKCTTIYHQPYKSTDFILFPNTNQPPIIDRKNSLYKNVKFNYVNYTPASSYSSQRSLKRTKSEENLANNSEIEHKQRKSQYKIGGNKRNNGDIFYDMDQGQTFQDKKKTFSKQRTSKSKVKQYQTLTKPQKVKTTQISSQKKPNIFQQYASKLKHKQTRLIAVVLITLAVVIFIIQLTS